MRITRRMKNHYKRVLFNAVILIACILTGVIVSWQCCIRKISHTEKRENVNLYMLNKDVEAGEVLKEKHLSVQAVSCGNGEMKEVSLQEFIGKQAKYPLLKGTILSDQLVTMKDEAVEDKRKLCYSYIRNAYELKKGDYIDVRIAFPNGADFTILSKKEVLQTEDNENGVSEGIWLGVTEEELLRMSSGVVDSYMLDGAYIYATLYINTLQRETIVNYPVNVVVQELIKKNPNIVAIAQERKTLELRNKIFEKNEEVEEKREEVQKQEEGLVYFD